MVSISYPGHLQTPKSDHTCKPGLDWLFQISIWFLNGRLVPSSLLWPMTLVHCRQKNKSNLHITLTKNKNPSLMISFCFPWNNFASLLSMVCNCVKEIFFLKTLHRWCKPNFKLQNGKGWTSNERMESPYLRGTRSEK